MCSTPSQDEIPYYLEVNKVFRKEDLNKDLYYPDDTDHTDMMPPKSPEAFNPMFLPQSHYLTLQDIMKKSTMTT